MVITIQIVSQLQLGFEDNELQVVSQNIDSASAIANAHQLKPNIILLDNSIKESSSPALIQSLLDASPISRIILLGSSLPDKQLIKCLLSKLYGYVEQKDLDRFLIKSIKAVHSGEAWITRRIVKKLIESINE